MWFENIFGGSNTAVMDRTIQFTEARHKVLTNNIANIDTPGYKMRDLEIKQFQNDLQKAIDQRSISSESSEAELTSSTDFNQYLLFHDQNNRSPEKQITTITENAVLHNIMVELLRNRYTLLDKAIALRP